jgi:hypothetical protein
MTSLACVTVVDARPDRQRAGNSDCPGGFVVRVEVEQEAVLLGARAVECQKPVDVDCPYYDCSARWEARRNVGARGNAIDDAPRGAAPWEPLSDPS